MPERIEERLRDAMRLAAEEVRPSPHAESARSELVAGVAYRRQRRQRRAVGSVAMVAALACAGSIVGANLAGHPGVHRVQAAASAPYTSPKSASDQVRGRAGTSSVAQAPTPAGQGSSISPTASGIVSQDAPQRNGPSGPKGFSGIPASPATPPLSASTATGAATPTSARPILVTQVDSGLTIAMTVGQTLTVTLSGTVSLPWTRPISANRSVVAPTTDSGDPITGDYYASLRAVSAGTTTVAATQGPGHSWRIAVAVTSSP